MKVLSSCKEAITHCIEHKYFAIAHLYKEETAMNMHIHDCLEIYYSISGGKQFLIGNKFYGIAPGDIFVINQYESHHLTQIDTEIHERIVLSISPEYLKQLSSVQTDLSCCFHTHSDAFSHRLSLNKEQQQRFLYFINKITSIQGYGEDLLQRAAFIELMIFLNSAYLENTQCLSVEDLSPKYNKQVDDILAYINRHIHETITTKKLSQQFFLSDSYICRVFKSTTGMTINKYLTARRISIAKALLADGLSVNEVCECCGYNDYSNFVKTFTKIVGISPKKYAQLSVC
ncbi:MAG: AraC family transcriptional regulator [Niameybacter sp.]|uniref:helix-turn-helix transcriptional regulator n=1 Tax=Niameybacter sp. TaxID=2033640 RepID=UPI002FC8A8E2